MWFYRQWREEGLAPTLALREAQRWLRDTTNREKAVYFGQDDPELLELLELAGLRMPATVAAGFFSEAISRTEGLERRSSNVLGLLRAVENRCNQCEANLRRLNLVAGGRSCSIPVGLRNGCSDLGRPERIT